MSAFDPQVFENTNVDESGDPPEVGTYIVVLDGVRAFTSEAGADYVALTVRVAVGEPADHAWDILYSFKSPGATKVTKTALARIETDMTGVTSLQDLDARVRARVGEWLEVAVVASRNPDFPKPSTFINGLADRAAWTPLQPHELAGPPQGGNPAGQQPQQQYATDVPGFVPQQASAGAAIYGTDQDW